jgi:hypothetical protein
MLYFEGEHKSFPKPVKAEKIKKPWQPGKKKEKVIAPWRQDILSTHKSNPSKADRAVFPPLVVAEAKERSKGICEYCKAAACTTTHHVRGKGGRGGRGVLSNAYRVCGTCHIEIEGSEEKKQEIIALYEMKFGQFFWFDEQDWNEHALKQAAENEFESAKMIRAGQLEPIVELLTAASGRMLKAKELRLLDKLGVGEMQVFAKLMADIVKVGLTETKEQIKPDYGYGKFYD